ncbi:MAG: iron ABC transporter permease [Gammaproteobacteria bacterium]|nr:MAG: iron ABC transporter permease [Gammaproteobacteria bacterium]
MSSPQHRQVEPAGILPGWLGGVWPPAGLLLALVMGSFLVGEYPISPTDLITVVYARLGGGYHGLPGVIETALWSRLPRVAAAVLVGAALAAAGATYQGIFRNPLASPDILGVSGGAGLGATIGILLSLPPLAIQLMAFVFGLGTLLVVYLIKQAVRSHDPIFVLVLAGVVMGALAGACISLLQLLADPYGHFPALTFWLLGSLAAVTLSDITAIVPLIFIGLVPLYLLRRRMNLVSSGTEETHVIGGDMLKMRVLFICTATLMTAAAVSISGIIGWVGLMIPHIARMLVGSSFPRLLSVSIMLGASYLLAVDDLARTATVIEIPLGFLTAVFGAPFFLWLLVKTRRGW